MRCYLTGRFQRLRTHLPGPRVRALLSMPLALGVLLPVWWMASLTYEEHLLLEERQHAGRDLAPYVTTFSQATHERFAFAESLKAFIALRAPEGISREQFDLYGAELFSAAHRVRTSWIPAEEVYRYLGREARGEGPSTREAVPQWDPRVVADVVRAIQSEATTLTGPRHSAPNSLEWIAWVAVYRDGSFLGLIAMEMDPLAIVAEVVSADLLGNVELALRDRAGNVFYGREEVFHAQPVAFRIQLPEGYWELAAIPLGGWESAISRSLLVARVSGLVIVALLLCLVYFAVSRQLALTAAVARHTQELARVNQELREDIAKREQVEAERERLLEELEQHVAERTHHLKAIYDVAAVARASLDLQTILERSLDRILAAVGSEIGAIHLYDAGDGMLRAVAARGLPGALLAERKPAAEPRRWAHQGCWVFLENEPLVVPDTAADPRTVQAFGALGARAHVSVPIRGKGGAMGVLCLFRDQARPFSPEEVALLAAIGDQLGVVVENVRLFAHVQDEAAFEERQRLARELHDSVTQLLYSLTLMAEACRRFAAGGNASRAEDYLVRLGETAQQALKEMRLLVYELRPSGLTQEGLAVALQQRLDAVEKRAGLQARLLIAGVLDLPPAVEEALYRIAQEALNNTLKHAGATSVTVEIRAEGDSVVLEISDDGKGFDPSRATDRGGLGLVTMRERAERLGGSLSVWSSPHSGVKVYATVPLTRNRPALVGGGQASRGVEVPV